MMVKPILEKWASVELDDLITHFGIRRYVHGNQLPLHVDGLPHVMSAVLQIQQEVLEDWPLTLIDHQGLKNKVQMWIHGNRSRALVYCLTSFI